MQIADLRLAVRPRSAWEAVDLGIRLVQAEAGPLWRVWFALLLPLMALVLIAEYFLNHGWLYLLLWWLKPLYDYALLIVLSRRVFGETPTIREVFRELATTPRKGLFGWLGWRRLSMSRAYQLPVWLLENLPADERRPRLALLLRQHGGRANWLHVVMVHFEAFLSVTLISLLFWFAPAGLTTDLWSRFMDGGDHLANISGTLAWFVALTVIEPFYVAAGFSLYLNRRTELEAWDLELAFRHLQSRLDSQRGSS